jgi:hypothetical protein
MTKVALDAVGTSTTLESNKSHGDLYRQLCSSSKKLALITELFWTYMEPLCCVSRGKTGQADAGRPWCCMPSLPLVLSSCAWCAHCRRCSPVGRRSHIGSARVAPRLRLLPPASPLCFTAKEFKRHRRGRTCWHGTCSSLRACMHRWLRNLLHVLHHGPCDV